MSDIYIIQKDMETAKAFRNGGIISESLRPRKAWVKKTDEEVWGIPNLPPLEALKQEDRKDML